MHKQKWRVQGGISTGTRWKGDLSQATGSRGPLFLIRGGQSKMTTLTCSNRDIPNWEQSSWSLNTMFYETKGPGKCNLKCKSRNLMETYGYIHPIA